MKWHIFAHIAHLLNHPRERGLKPWRDRGTFYKDLSIIICIHQRKGLTYFHVPLQQSLLDIICKNVNYGSTVFTDEL